MTLSRDDILNASDLSVELVKVPEWGGEVNIRTMTGTERDAWESSLFETKAGNTKANMENLRAKLLVQCIVDDEGAKLFTEKDIHKLGAKSAKALDRLYSIARDLNGVSASDEEELVKN